MTIGWRDTWPGVLKKSVLRWSSRSHWQHHREVARGLEIPPIARGVGGVWAIAMVKNEADIIEASVLHQLDQGVDHILIVDNGSEDGTLEVLRELQRDHPVHVGIDTEVGYYQAHKMTSLAAAARHAGAEWIVPFDADEFWFAPDTDVATYLRRAAGTRVEASIYNAFPTSDTPELRGLADVLRLDASPHLLAKVAAKPHPLLWISTGNHEALRPGESVGGLRVLHLPWRSREQLRRKVRQGAKAYAATSNLDGIGGHWRELGKQGEHALDALWKGILDGDGDESLGWRPVGPFVNVRAGEWKTWDPEHVIPGGVPVQRPTFSSDDRKVN